MTLQRIVVALHSEEMVLRVLYRSDRCSNPGTQVRAREVSELARSGLRDALEALEGSEAGVDVVGTSGYTTREDVLCITTPTTPAVVHKETKERSMT